MPKHTPLYEVQKKIGGQFVEFAGWEMPVQYTGIVDEHMAVRQNVGIFDVSHMSNVWVKGPDAAKLIGKCTLYNPDKLKIGQAKYSAFPRDDATIIDDTIFMKFEDGFFVVPNAGMNEIVTAWLKKQAQAAGLNVEVTDCSNYYAIIAVQGPKAEALMQNLVATDIRREVFGKFKCAKTKVCGADAILSRTGYTGEDGFEINLANKDAEHVFMTIFENGREYGIRACGLGCRDTLRLEKGMMLAGHEFHGGRTPVEAGIDWAASWDHDFIGKEVMEKQKASGQYPHLVGLKMLTKGIPRNEYEIQKDGKKIGAITSGSMSPILKLGIAMGYVPPEFAKIGEQVDVIIRGKPEKAEIVKMPFV